MRRYKMGHCATCGTCAVSDTTHDDITHGVAYQFCEQCQRDAVESACQQWDNVSHMTTYVLRLASNASLHTKGAVYP